MASIVSIKKKIILKEKLYNIAVKDDESYIADGVVVHNCRSILIPIMKDEMENKSIFGASKEENDKIFPDGKFKSGDKYLDKYKQQPGGFWVENKGE